jgi:uncharacterized protein with FMN-binding domain
MKSTMKKLLLSCAVLAGSGAYVAYQSNGASLRGVPVVLQNPPAVAARGNDAATQSLPVPSPTPQLVQVADTAAAAKGQYRDGNYQGTSANAYYGRVQVNANIKNGKLASVDVLSYPNDRRTSRNINEQALPLLEQEAIQAQSADVDIVSGATLTSHAYVQSLNSALASARGSHA